jgi:hypothetical protein
VAHGWPIVEKHRINPGNPNQNSRKRCAPCLVPSV